MAMIPAKKIFFDEPMSEHTSSRIGGPADALVLPESTEEVRNVVKYCASHRLPLFIMGNGSNLLVLDGGIRGVVLKIAGCLNWSRTEGNVVEAGAGITLHDLAEAALSASLSGLEFASGIPGTFGGAIFMNAGAYGGEMKDVVFQVDAVDLEGNLVTLMGDEIAFGYRDSALQKRNLVAVSAKVRLMPKDRSLIEARMLELDALRKAKQPLKMPSAGSTFKRPPGHYAGSLIESSGLKGFRVGGAQVSTLHAGFVVNLGGATSKDVLNLIGEVQKRVYAKHKVHLTPEVRIVGEDPEV
jgi:UDP-N-acetylmuramate dehydrogenase